MKIILDAIKIKATFKKDGMMRFISHLDFIRLIYRALRRADIPFVLTQGFSPHPKVKFDTALKLGVRGKMGVMFFLRTKMALLEFKDKMDIQLNKDLRTIDINYAE
ncbi:MAG: TIGR03936 family radical SAM-associated protein [Candidatus Omnitrophica bacterium]|nr:TIGR03936 family radical SAM-associated protein [Candidatus Omnitrophota bacterium]